MPLLLKKVIFLTLFLFLTGEAFSLALASPDAKAEKKGAVWLPPANETLTYDAAGNRQSSAQFDYGWDAKNQLIRIRTKNHTTVSHAYDLTFTYDSEGRRVKKHVIEYQNGGVVSEKIITFLWDDWDLLYERHQMPSGLTLLERKYLWGPDIADGEAGGAGGLLLISETKGNSTQNIIPLYDGTGHVIALTDIEKNLLASYAYGPFGERISAQGSHANTNPWRWATKYLDEETGLYYFGHRYYDPITGQWLSREPLGEEESLNLYSYCHNDPVNKVDVQGLEERVIANAEPKLFITGNTADGNYIGWATEKDGMFQAFQPTGNFYYQGPFTESQAREIQTNGGRLDLRRKGASLAFKSEQLQDSIHRLEVAKFYVANTAQAAAGVGEAAAGVLAEPVTFGVSTVAVAHGADVTSTALMRMWNGPGIDTQSNTSLAFQAIGFDRNTAEYGDSALSFVVPAAQVTNLVMKMPVPLSRSYAHPVKVVSSVDKADDFITLYRGDQAGFIVIKSHAACEGGYANSAGLIKTGNLDDLMSSHAISSSNPASPFISVTSDPNVARFFAGPGGVVRELRIPSSRALPNPHNNMVVPAGPGGSLVPEAEFLVPNYIRPSEIIRKFRQ